MRCVTWITFAPTIRSPIQGLTTRNSGLESFSSSPLFQLKFVIEYCNQKRSVAFSQSS
jgi:hypothetical protein